MYNFTYSLKQQFIIDGETLWVAERMCQEVFDPELNISWINELYLLTPVKTSYKMIATQPQYKYYDVSELSSLEKSEAV